MAYTNRNFTWDFDALKRFYEKYIVKWINSAVSWTEAQKKQARANLGFGDGDGIAYTEDNTSSDLDVTDENKNVLMRLKDGHIKTKNFDSSKNTLSEADVAKVATVEEGAQANDVVINDTDSDDLDFSDEQGNVIMRLSNGHIITKNFNSAKAKKTIRLLSIGNSYSQDALAYVPFILQNMGIDADIQIGIAMLSSSTLANHVDNFENENAVYTYWLHTNGDAWQTVEGKKTLQYILNDKTWDIVSLQQSSGGVFNWSTYQPHLNKLINYISSYVKNPVKFCWYAVQARPASTNSAANWSDTVITQHFEAICENAEKVMNETICEFLVPVNTAIQNARSIASLKAMGAYASNTNNTSGLGYLTHNDGVHLQEGLPCQIAAYTFTLFILNVYGFTEKSIIGETTRVTSDWEVGKNIPAPHGTPIGSTDENCKIGQMCAIMAIKNPYSVTDMNYIINPT